MMIFSPDDPQAFTLKARYEAFKAARGGAMPAPAPRSAGGGSSGGFAKTIEGMVREDLALGPPPVPGQQLSPDGPKAVHRHHVVATVTQIPTDRMPCYPACPEMVAGRDGAQRACQKKLTQDSPGLWRCQL